MEREIERDVQGEIRRAGGEGEECAGPGPNGAIDPGKPYIRDRKPESRASSSSPRNPPLLSPLTLADHIQSNILSLLAGSYWGDWARQPSRAAVNSSSPSRLAAPVAKCTQSSIHNPSFIILVGLCELLLSCLRACLLRLLF